LSQETSSGPFPEESLSFNVYRSGIDHYFITTLLLLDL